MTCFWTETLGTTDPACGLPPAHLYAKTSIMRISSGDDFGGGYDYAVDGNAPIFNDALFTDSLFTTPATATTAVITSLVVYSGVFANCDAACWCACANQDDTYLMTGCYPGGCVDGADPESPPTTGLLATYAVSISFSPTGLFPFVAALSATPVIDGSTHHDSATIVVATVETDVGTTLYIFGGETCY